MIFPCIIGISDSFEQSGTTCRPNTGVFPAASFASYAFGSKVTFVHLKYAALLARFLEIYTLEISDNTVFIVFRFNPNIALVFVALMSLQNHLNIFFILYSLIFLLSISLRSLSFFMLLGKSHFLLKKFYQDHINDISKSFADITAAKTKYGSNGNYFYMHILSPHELFVFDGKGEISEEKTYNGMLITTKQESSTCKDFIRKYTNQVKTISVYALKAIHAILEQYPKNNQPIIILHGDHGYSCIVKKTETIHKTLKENTVSMHTKSAFGNLFALYIPEEWKKNAINLEFINLYPFVFNHLFDLNYKYLPPKHFINGLEILHSLLTAEK